MQDARAGTVSENGTSLPKICVCPWATRLSLNTIGSDATFSFSSPYTPTTPPRTPTRYPPNVKLERTKIPWDTPEERQRAVSALHAKGYQLHEVARRLSVDVQTVRRDKRKLSLETWSTISDAELSTHVEANIALAHTAVGTQKMGAYLLRQGLRVQDHRVKAALVSRSTAP